jgi:hypothetical protein
MVLDLFRKMVRKIILGAIFNNRGLIILLSVLALSSGGLIYIFLRPSEYLFFTWPKNLGLGQWLNFSNYFSGSLYQLLPAWFIYSFPNGLWAFAYSLLITGIWWNTRSQIKYFWIGTIPVFVLGWELFQLSNVIPGTFSLGDIIFGLAGILSGFCIGIKLTKLNNHEKESV